MEIIAVIFILIGAFILLKIAGFFLNAGLFVITLPFKIIFGVLAGLFFLLICIPLGTVAGLAGLLIAPLALLIPLLPIALVIFGVVWLVRRS